MIFDSHCHLNDDKLLPDVELHIKEAVESGVTHFLIVGWNLKSSKLAVELANKFPNCYAAIGIHPTDTLTAHEDDLLEIEQLAENEKVKAIGEIGLDYYWVKEDNDRQIQKEWFIKQIELANKLDLPIVIHNRDSNQDCLEILKNHKTNQGGVMHCFSGSYEIAVEVIKLGYHISFGGPVTFKNAKTPKDVASRIDLSHILVETDCPYLTPHPYRGTLNSPKYTKLVCQEIANLKNISVEEVESITFENAKNVFHV